MLQQTAIPEQQERPASAWMEGDTLSRLGLFALLWAGLLLFFPLPSSLSGLQTVWSWPGARGTQDGAALSEALLVAVPLLAVMTGALARHGRVLFRSPLLMGAAGIVFLLLLRAGNREALVAVALWGFFFAGTWLRADDRRVLLGVLLGLFGLQVMAVLGAYFLVYEPFVTPRFGRRAGGLQGSPNMIYAWSLLWFFLFLEWGRALPQGRTRRLMLAGAAGSFCVLLLTFSRAGWLGLAVAAPLALRQSGTALRVACCVGVVLLIVGAATLRTRGEIVSPQNDGSTRGRLRIWKDAWRVWRQSPWIGHGAGTLPRLSNLITPSVEPKNLLLQIAVQTGLLGIALYGLVAAGTWRASRQVAVCSRAALGDRALARATGLAVVALGAAGLFDTPVFGYLDRIAPTATLLLFLGMTQGAARDSGV